MPRRYMWSATNYCTTKDIILSELRKGVYAGAPRIFIEHHCDINWYLRDTLSPTSTSTRSPTITLSQTPTPPLILDFSFTLTLTSLSRQDVSFASSTRGGGLSAAHTCVHTLPLPHGAALARLACGVALFLLACAEDRQPQALNLPITTFLTPPPKALDQLSF